MGFTANCVNCMCLFSNPRLRSPDLLTVHVILEPEFGVYYTLENYNPIMSFNKKYAGLPDLVSNDGC
jgi:hypothetical protein